MDRTDLERSQTEINGHSVIVEPDRILHFIIRGDLRLEESKFVQSRLYELSDRYGRIAFLIDVTKMAGFDAATRQAWVHVPKPFSLDVACLYGGSFTIRTLIKTVYRAAVLLHPSFFQFALELPRTEEEARAIIAAYRAKARDDGQANRTQ